MEATNPYNNRPECIKDLNPEALKKLLKKCFAAVGKEYNLTDNEVIEGLFDAIYKYYRSVWTETFYEAFVKAAAGDLGEKIQETRTEISIRYIAIVWKAYKGLRGWDTKPGYQTDTTQLNNIQDCKRATVIFIQWCKFYRHINPNPPSWLKIWNYLAYNGNIQDDNGNNMTMVGEYSSQKEKLAEEEVRAFMLLKNPYLNQQHENSQGLPAQA